MSDKWFSQLDSNTLCRGGGNGPLNPSQLFGMAFIDLGNSILDVGCGSGASLETMRKVFGDVITYKGVDFIDKHIDWCKETFDEEFEVQDALNLKEEDESWDVVWSRHVVDHLAGFEVSMKELMRVAKKKVICTLWVPLTDLDEHQIKPIVDQGKTYESEWTNIYSKKLVEKFLDESGWDYRMFEDIGYTNKKTDTVIIMERK